jgi:hypothetical protein
MHTDGSVFLSASLHLCASAPLRLCASAFLPIYPYVVSLVTRHWYEESNDLPFSPNFSQTSFLTFACSPVTIVRRKLFTPYHSKNCGEGQALLQMMSGAKPMGEDVLSGGHASMGFTCGGVREPGSCTHPTAKLWHTAPCVFCRAQAAHNTGETCCGGHAR